MKLLNKKNICRITAIILIITNIISLTACFDIKENTNTKKTVSILAKNSWYSDVDYEDTPVIKQMSDNSGYNIEWKLREPSNYYDLIRELILNGDSLADIVQLPDLDKNMDYINTGKFAALDEYFEYMPNFQKFLDENNEIKASLTTDTGHIYYIPQLVLTKNYVPCIMYNTKWLNSIGKAAPSTLDEFVELLKIYKTTDINGNGLTDEIPLCVTSDNLAYMFGPAFGLNLVDGFYEDDDGKIKYSYYNNDNYKQYLEFVNMLYNEGLLYSNYNNATRDTIKDMCANNTLGVTFDYSWHMSMLYSAQYSDYTGESPVFESTAPLSGTHEGYYIGRNAISGLFGVTKSDNTVDAIKLLDYMISDDNETSYCFGILNESYTINDNNKKAFTAQAHDDTYVQHLGINPICVPSMQSVEATDALVPAWHSQLDKKLAQYVKSPFPLIYSTESEVSLNNDYTSYIAKYVSSQTNEFITGHLPLTELDSFNATLKNMGIENMIALRQVQYNRYKKNLTID